MLPWFKSLFNWILDIIFGVACLGCHKSESILCSKCIASIRPAERETSSGVVAAYDYRDPLIKRAIWSLKYHKHRHIGQKLGQMVYDALLEEVADMRTLSRGELICVIPVPLSRTRKKMRGYNQALVIAQAFCESSKEKIFEIKKDIIVKKVDTLPQARITNRVARLRNIHDAFQIIKPDVVKGRTIIIIDDVTTTGGTITEIIKLLKAAGAKKVVGFAVAH